MKHAHFFLITLLIKMQVQHGAIFEFFCLSCYTSVLNQQLMNISLRSTGLTTLLFLDTLF